MKSRYSISRILLSIFLVMGSGASQEVYGQEEQESSATEALAHFRVFEASDARRVRIQKELIELGPDHKWAGVYYLGDGLGTNISLYLAPLSGFDYRWEGCLGLYDFDYGHVEVQDQSILLHPHRKHEEMYQWVVAEPYHFVLWDARHYLIPESKLINFCNAINAHKEPRVERRGAFFLREGDENLPVNSLPNLPAPYREYLLSTPLTAIVLDVVGETEIDEMPAHLVAINAGRVERVFVGMRLYAIERGSVQWLDILKVDDHTAIGASYHIFDEDSSKPERGWKFSTLPDWKRE